MRKKKSIALTLFTAVLSLGLAFSISACEDVQTSSSSSASSLQSSESTLLESSDISSGGMYSTEDAESSEATSSSIATESSEAISSSCEVESSEESYSFSSAGSSEESSLDSESSEHVHEWSEWIISKGPSCGEEGEQYRFCVWDTSHRETESIAKLPHSICWYEAQEPTCKENGWEAYEACLGCSYSTYKEIPATGVHDFPYWISTDNVTMSTKCNNCDEELKDEVPSCEHLLTLSSYINDNGMIVSEGLYTCDNCALKFEPCDVLTITFSNAAEEGYYRMEIASKIARAEYDYRGFMYKTLNVEIEDGCDFSYQYTWEDNKNKIREIVFGENIAIVGKIDYYEYVYTVVFGEQVEKIKTDCTCDLFSLKEIYFEGDIPELEADALWRRGAAVAGEPFNPLAPIVYYKEDAEGFAEYGYKLQGCGLRQLGQAVAETPEISMLEYAAKTNARALDMATELFEAAAKTRRFLQFYPFCSLEKYKPIKDLAISLTEGLSTDTEKAKAIFDWIVENITYDDAAMYYSVEKVFEERIAVCAGYAGLLHDMLAAVEIPSIYTAGISYFGTECTVQDILDDEENYKYRGNGHGWLICLLDGEALFCDATWGNFAFTAEELTAELLATTRMNGLSVIPEDFDPALYESLLYYDEGEVYYLNDGYLSTVDQFGVLINFTYQFNYEFRTSNDGFQYGFGIVENKSAYRDVLICYGEHDYKLYFFHGTDYLRYNYMEILKFVAFERLWYDNQIEIDFYEEFVFDEYGTIYHINEENVLSVAATVAEVDTLIIPESINGMQVTSIDDNALQGCYAKEIILPNSIEKIGAQAFMGCINIESLVLPTGLKHIEPGAFAYCMNLKTITMYTGVEFIGYKDNHRLCVPNLLFEEIPVEQLTVVYQGTEEEFNKIHFNDPYIAPEELTFDTIQYEHVKGYVSFIEQALI